MANCDGRWSTLYVKNDIAFEFVILNQDGSFEKSSLQQVSCATKIWHPTISKLINKVTHIKYAHKWVYYE